MESRLSIDGRLSMDGRLSVDGRGSILVRRNREIAEVREEMNQMDLRLKEAQAKNAILLEETSVLDSTIFEHSGRAGNSEAQLAELMYKEIEQEEELARQRAANARDTAALEDQVGERTEKVKHAQADMEAKHEAVSVLEDEIASLQALLEAEDRALADVRRRRQEPSFGLEQQRGAAEAEALRSVQEALAAVSEKEQLQQEDMARARQRIEGLELELSEERGRREDVSTSLRRAVVEQAEGPKRLRAAEAAVAARGGGSGGLRGAEVLPERLPQLRSELSASEEQCRSLQASIDAQKAQDGQAVERLTEQLDGARGELQQSLQQAKDAHNSEVAKLEQEIQAERQRTADEQVAERICSDQVAQLKGARSRAHDERGCAIVRAQAEAGRCAALVEELQRVQGEVGSVEGRLVAIQERILEAEQRRGNAQKAGMARAAKVKEMIQSLWQGLRTAQESTTTSSPKPAPLH